MSDHSGFVPYHALVIYCCIHEDTTSLSNDYKNKEAFASHAVREMKNEDETKEYSCAKLTKSFFDDVITLQQNTLINGDKKISCVHGSYQSNY